MFDRSNLRRGLDVYDRDGHKIGSIEDVGPNYVHVSTGFLGLGPDLYVPFSAIDRVGDDRAMLNVSRDEIASRRWDQRPSEAPTPREPTRAAEERPAAAPTGAAAGETRARAGAGPTLSPDDVIGHNLCDVNGSNIGKVVGAGPNYLHVTTGILGLGENLYIPIESIDHCTRDCCYLNVTTDQVRRAGWRERPTEARAAAGAPAAPTEGAPRTYRIPLREEEIEVHRHREKVGEVVISKDVVEERRTIDVPVERDEVRIERRPVSGPETGPETPIEAGAGEGPIRVPIYEERVDVSKHAHTVEEVVVSPEHVTREQEVTETVRREVPRVRTTGEAGEYVEGEEKLEERPTTERPAAERPIRERTGEARPEQPRERRSGE